MDYGSEQHHFGGLGAGMGSLVAQEQDEKWRAAFLRVAAALGVSQSGSSEPQTAAVEGAVRELQASDAALQAVQQREAALQLQVSHLTLENLELRRELSSGWAAAEPSVLQVRQLMLDPAVQGEFRKLRAELEGAKQSIRHLKEQNDSLTFTAESKTGRALINKTKLLAQENSEMAAQLAERPGAASAALLSLERRHVSELAGALTELRHHAGVLEQENEELNMLRFLHERQIREAAEAAAPQPPPERQRERERDGRDHHQLYRGGGSGGSGGYRGRGRGRDAWRGRGRSGSDNGRSSSAHKRSRYD